MVTASDCEVVYLCWSGGHSHDTTEGRALPASITRHDEHIYLLVDKAYEGDETRFLAIHLGYISVVPPQANHLAPWNMTSNATSREMKSSVISYA